MAAQSRKNSVSDSENETDPLNFTCSLSKEELDEERVCFQEVVGVAVGCQVMKIQVTTVYSLNEPRSSGGAAQGSGLTSSMPWMAEADHCRGLHSLD